MSASDLSVLFAGISVGIAAIFRIIDLVNENRARRLTLETRQVELLDRIQHRTTSSDYWELFEEIIRKWDWTDFDDYLEKYGQENNPAAHNQMLKVCVHWEHVGLLVRDGLIDADLIWHWVGAYPISLWNKLEPVIREFRAQFETPPKGMMFEWFEDLVYRLRIERKKDRERFPERLRARQAMQQLTDGMR
jgi:hypothetical protein